MAETLSWKSLPTYTPDASILTAVNLIAGIKAALQQTVYVDGSARAAGSGVAWTATSLADGSLKCEPVGNAHNLLVHFATQTQTSASTPMAFGETKPASGERVFGTIVMNPGTYTSLSATPWGTDPTTRVFGYCVASPVYSGTTGSTSGMGGLISVRAIKIYESKDALFVLLDAMLQSGASSYGPLMLPLLYGGFLAPLTGDAADAESDGVLYGMTTHGGVGQSPNWYNTYAPSFYSSTAFLGHSANGSATAASGVSGTHAGVLMPGTSTVRTFTISSRFANGLTTINQKLVKMPIYVGNSTNIFGRVREMTVYKNGLIGTVLRADGVDKGHIVGMNSSSATDAVLLAI